MEKGQWDSSREGKRKKSVGSLKCLYNFTVRRLHTNIHIIEVPEGEERERSRNRIQWNKGENFLNMEKEAYIHFQEAHRVPKRWIQRDSDQDTL